MKDTDEMKYHRWLAERNLRGSVVLEGESQPHYTNFVADGFFPLDPAGSVVILVHEAIQTF